MTMSRTLLENTIILHREDGSSVKFHIKSHIGSGASCVVYLADCDDNTEHLLKEYYPRYLCLDRDSNGNLIIPDHKKENFETGRVRFREGCERQKEVRRNKRLTNFTSNVQNYFFGYNTEYIDMTVQAGRTYDQVGDESLHTLLRRMKVLAQVIGEYHAQGLLHLDIKPENIYVRPENETVEDVLLFDFDSVIEESRKMEYSALSYTKTWAAPEQLLSYKRSSICKATDLFSIGEIIFTKIYGRHSTSAERRSFAKYNFDHEASIFKNVNPKVYPLLKELLSHTICNVVERRYQTTDELISMLDEIIPLADPKAPYLITTLPTPKEFFIGRDAEIKDIHTRLQQSSVLFLHGIGGIGKSELAKQYAKKYQSEYDTIIFAPYVTDIVSLIANDSCIQINNFCRTQDQNIREYYAKKIEIIKNVIENHGNQVLLIVDNLDTLEDPNLNDILSLGCRVLVTSRVDFSHDYAQMELNTLSDPFAIFNEYYKKPLSDTESDEVNEIINIVGGHTMTVELIAKQMMASRIIPEQMLAKLKLGGISDSGNEKVNSAKDGNFTMQSTFDHIQSLFDLSDLDNDSMYVLSNLSLIPNMGISAELFCKLCKIDNFDVINRLTKLGWIRRDMDDTISLHSIVADIAYNTIENKKQIMNLIEFADSDLSDLSMKPILDYIKLKSFKILMKQEASESHLDPIDANLNPKDEDYRFAAAKAEGEALARYRIEQLEQERRKRLEAEALTEQRKNEQLIRKKKIREEKCEKRKKDPAFFAHVSLWIGILSFFAALVSFVTVPIGIRFGCKGLKTSKKKIAIAGIVVNSLCAIFLIICIVLGIILTETASPSPSPDEIVSQNNYQYFDVIDMINAGNYEGAWERIEEVYISVTYDDSPAAFNKMNLLKMYYEHQELYDDAIDVVIEYGTANHYLDSQPENSTYHEHSIVISYINSLYTRASDDKQTEIYPIVKNILKITP